MERPTIIFAGHESHQGKNSTPMGAFEKELRASLGLKVPEEDAAAPEGEKKQPEEESPLTRKAEATLKIATDAIKKQREREQAYAEIRRNLGLPKTKTL